MSLIMGGAESFPFDNIGDGFTNALVTEISDEQQATDLDTGELRFWDPGKTQPVKQVVVSLELGPHDRTDANDDGARSLFVQASSNRQKAIASAVRASGAKEFLAGSYLSMHYTAEGEKKNKGWNPPKIYQAQYTPPQGNGGASIMGDQAPAQQQVPAQQPPVQQPPVQQQAPVQAPPMQPSAPPQPVWDGQQWVMPQAPQMQQQAPQQPQGWPQQGAPVQQLPMQQPAPQAPVQQQPQGNGLDMTGIPPEAQRLIQMQQQGQQPQQ